ncbi:unnamed protein product [Toxocara canis]|uniref:Integrase catalytic domain-containing protein n=1 Tax=Toxocara canis TaxID=6265 RepID=A0A183TXJ5_TOXCA|nr:unnamed protein product [Toxocara canis]
MNTRKFASNSEEFMKSIPDEDAGITERMKFLGVPWNPIKDELVVRIPDLTEYLSSKREILSFTAACYDPVGFLVPAFMEMKIFLQNLWKDHYEWDEILDAAKRHEWQNITKSSVGGDVIHFPRYAFRRSSSTQLHIFTDASSKAYATAYVRSRRQEREETNLMFARCRLAPIAGMSIPRLELMGMLLGVRVGRFMKEQLELPDSAVHLWCDSKTVLYWARKPIDQLKMRFVQNRVREIQTATVQFHYVETNDNPADLATRGVAPHRLSQCSLWWKGPEWLKLNEEDWPRWNWKEEDIFEPDRTTEAADHEVETTNAVATMDNRFTETQNLHPPFGHFVNDKRFGRWNKLVAVTAMVLRFIKRIAKNSLTVLKRTSGNGHLSVDELREAEMCLIRQAQSEGDAKQIARWKLEWDAQNLWWISAGRMRDTRIYLPRHSHITELIILQQHEQSSHSGTDHVLANLNQKYWIPKGRATVKRTINRNCMPCRRWKAKTFKLPPMPQFPKVRVERNRPFSHVGLDYAGPLRVLTMEGSQKKWIALFTCLTTRAVHLELASSLSAESCLNVFRRFLARRGQPETVISDNGKNFLLSQRVIDLATERLARKKIKWKFIPDYAPW